MGRVLVVGDIHGAHRALIQVLERSGFNREEDRLITLGDVCDGWPETKKCIDELLSIPNHINVIGNHDCWGLNWMTSGWMQPIWTKQGGQATIDSYNLEQVVEWVPPNVPKEHINFLRESAHAVELEDNRLLVHGGIDWKKPLEEHTINELTWDRELVSQAKIRHPTKGRKKGVSTYKEIFVGHTTTEAFDDKLVPLNYCEVWLLDTGAGWSGRLTLMDIDTKEYWQSDLVSDLYKDIKGREWSDI